MADLKDMPDVICIQETWLKPQFDFVISGYSSVRCDRSGKQGGGCVAFIKDALTYRKINVPEQYECVKIEVCSPRGDIKVVNFYNPCKKLSLEMFHEISGNIGRREIWCGDFNAHNTLWGSECTDFNGGVVEEVIEERALICLNDGRGTRVDVTRNSVSCLDITLVSGNMSNLCEWNIMNDSNIGSDHYPILCSVNCSISPQKGSSTEIWCFPKANWGIFKECCRKACEDITIEGMWTVARE